MVVHGDGDVTLVYGELREDSSVGADDGDSVDNSPDEREVAAGGGDFGDGEVADTSDLGLGHGVGEGELGDEEDLLGDGLGVAALTELDTTMASVSGLSVDLAFA